MKKARTLAKKHGLDVTFFSGNLEMQNGDLVRGCISGDRVYVRVDHSQFTAEQITQHEIGHRQISAGEINVDAVVEQLHQTYSDEQLKQFADQYLAAYADSSMTIDEVWEEIICDALGGMNVFAGGALENGWADVLINTYQAAATFDPDIRKALNSGQRVNIRELSIQSRTALARSAEGMAIDAQNRLYKVDPAQHISRRTSASVGSVNVNAFQFDHPELHQYIAKAAEALIDDANGSLESGMHRKTERTAQGKQTRQFIETTHLLDLAMAQGLSRNEIIAAAQQLIESGGQENNAAAKRVELALDEWLTEGDYAADGYVPPNEDYIKARNEIPGYLEKERDELPLSRETRFSKEMNKNGREGQEWAVEARSEFLLRAAGENKEHTEGRRSSVSFRVSGLLNAEQTNAGAVQRELTALGIKSYLYSGGLEVNNNGRTMMDDAGAAATIDREFVMVWDDVTCAPIHTAGHEALHVWGNTDSATVFKDAVYDHVRFGPEYIALASEIEMQYFPDGIDTSDIRQQNLFREEMAAEIAGMLHSGEDVSGLLSDPDAVKQAWQDLVRENAPGYQSENFEQEMRENGREGQERRTETRDAFLRRAAGEGYGVFEGAATAYGYRSVRDATAGRAGQVHEELTKLGIQSDIVDGDVLSNKNGVTKRNQVLEACTASSEYIFISKDTTLSPRRTAGHEAFHLWKNEANRAAYIEAIEDNLLFNSEEFRFYQSAIAERYFDGEVDLTDDARMLKMREELFAYISGDIHEGTNDAYLRPMFRDFDAVKQAWQGFVRENAPDYQFHMDNEGVSAAGENALSDTRFSRETDRKYQDAVESGNILEAQRMVDKAARDAGYVQAVFHGTDGRFNRFDRNIAKQKAAEHRWLATYPAGTIFLANKRTTASGYGSNTMDLYLDTSGMKTFKHKDMYAADAMDELHTKDISEYPVIAVEGSDATIYATLSGTRVKRTDAAIYDDNGNLIPLSRRFNKGNPDVRYSRETDFNQEDMNYDQGRTAGVESIGFQEHNGTTDRTGTETFSETVDNAAGRKSDELSARGSGINADAAFGTTPNARIEYAPTFYSKMEQVIDEMKLSRIGAENGVNYLKGRGVKDEEIKWSGIAEFLKGKKSVSKEELLEFVRGNQLEIEEVEKSGSDYQYNDEQLERLEELDREADPLWDQAYDLWRQVFDADIPAEFMTSDTLTTRWRPTGATTPPVCWPMPGCRISLTTSSRCCSSRRSRATGTTKVQRKGIALTMRPSACPKWRRKSPKTMMPQTLNRPGWSGNWRMPTKKWTIRVRKLTPV